MANLIGNEEPSNKPVRTQVYQATHDGADNRLPLMHRSFISFTYGGENIEDFNFVSVVSGDRMDRNIYANFEDSTSTYNVIDGQFYWGTHYTTNSLSLTLATDEIEEALLEKFKRMFTPGPPKELVLAEHPNRAIMARVSEVPQYHLLPFQKVSEKTINIGGNSKTYQVSTTVYRGEIDLKFVMDDPYWYSRENILPDSHYNVNNQWVSTLQDDDILKIIFEDGVPTRSMISADLTSKPFMSGRERVASSAPIVGQAHVGDRLAITKIQISTTGNNSTAYIFYAGTAKAPTKLSFSLTPTYSDEGYINFPSNNIYKEVHTQNANEYANYNKINVGTQEFKFTTPGILTGYNTAIKVVSSFSSGNNINDIRLKLMDDVHEYYSRAWALQALNKVSENVDRSTGVISNGFTNSFITEMKKLFGESIQPCEFTFNSATGEATGKFTINKYETKTTEENGETVTNIELTPYVVEENVGDMVYDKYLYLTDRNYFNSDNVVTENECTPVTADCELDNFNIEYRNRYL